MVIGSGFDSSHLQMCFDFFLLSRLLSLFNHGGLTAPKPSSFSDSRMPGLKTPFFSRLGMAARAPAMLLVLSQVS